MTIINSPGFLILATATLLLVFARHTVTGAVARSIITIGDDNDVAKDDTNDDDGPTVERCRDGRRVCYNNSKCVRNRKIDPTHGDYGYSCDCSPTVGSGGGVNFAGAECEFRASVYCDDARDDRFCTNGGTCGSYISGGRYYSGCHCTVGYSGAHCQYLRDGDGGGGGGTPGEALVLDIADNFYSSDIPGDNAADRRWGNGVVPTCSSVPVDGCRNDERTRDTSESHNGDAEGDSDAEGDAEGDGDGEGDNSAPPLDERLPPHDETPKPPIDPKTNPQTNLRPPYVYTGGQVTENVVHAVLHNSTTEIDRGAFNRRRNLISIDLMPTAHHSSGLTRIGDYAFRYCRSLVSVTVPASVVEIGESAFAGCASLEEVYVPSKTKIGRNAFFGCDKLPKVLLPTGYTHDLGRGL